MLFLSFLSFYLIIIYHHLQNNTKVALFKLDKKDGCIKHLLDNEENKVLSSKEVSSAVLKPGEVYIHNKATKTTSRASEKEIKLIMFRSSKVFLMKEIDKLVCKALYLYMPESNLFLQYKDKDCFACSKVVKKAYKCSSCRNVYYCGSDCQRQHWTSHKEECSRLKLERDFFEFIHKKK